MAIVFECPKCKEGHRVKDELAGKRAKCKNPNCRALINIPSASGVAASVHDAEALAAAAFSEELPPQETAPAAKIKFTCQFCSTEHEVDASMEGKNFRCTECGKIVRVPKKEAPTKADWRGGGDGKPMGAKRDVPKLEGATEGATYASPEALKKGGAFDEEEEEEPRDRKIRRIKQVIFGALFLALAVWGVMYFMRSRTLSKQEKWMDLAIQEIESEEGSKQPEIQAAIYRYAGEYRARSAKTKDNLDQAVKNFKQALGKLQQANFQSYDRPAMLIELSVGMASLTGTAEQVKDEHRLSWQDTQRQIQQPFEKIAGSDPVLREHGIRSLTRAFAHRQQGPQAFSVGRYAFPNEEAECAGRVGIELFLAGQKDVALEFLKKVPSGTSPAMTAFRLAIAPDQGAPADSPLIPAPGKGQRPSLETRLAYSEAWALQGKIMEAKQLAESPAENPLERARALILVATAQIEINKDQDGGAETLQSAAQYIAQNPQSAGWLTVRLAGLMAKAGKAEVAEKMCESISDGSVKAWARLEILRVRLSGRKERAEESWIEPINTPASATIATLLGRAEIARHNAAVGETSFGSTIEKNWPKGIVRPFGFAGTSLGNLDRSSPP